MRNSDNNRGRDQEIRPQGLDPIAAADSAKVSLQAIMAEMTSAQRAVYMAEIMSYCEDQFAAEFGRALMTERYGKDSGNDRRSSGRRM